MRNVHMGLVASVVAGLAVAQIAAAQRAGGPSTTPQRPAAPSTTAPSSTQAQSATTAPVLKDIEQTLGFVPQFFRTLPDHLLASWWSSMKEFQMNTNTQLDARTKELIGLAVASQIPCTYCIDFHTQAALANGATDQQVKEAVGMAAVTRMGSTLLNGLRVDEAQFRKDLQRLMKPSGKDRAPTSARRSP